MAKKPITTYYEYKRALTDFIIQNGSVMLADWQMQRFIDYNDLHSRFGITTAEVAKDTATILNQRPDIKSIKPKPVYDLPEYQLALRQELLPLAQQGLSDYEISKFIKSKDFLRKYNLEIEDVRIHLERLVKGLWFPLRPTLSTQFLTNRAYHNALCQRMQENGDVPLSDTSIRILIKRGGFDRSCGLDVETVRQDMYAVPNKYNVMVLRSSNATSPLNVKGANTPCTSEPKKTAPAKSESIVKPVSTLKAIDENMRKTLSTALNTHNDLLVDRHRVSGLLKDLFPEHRREVNILLQIYDLGILDELRRQQVINQLFIQRFTGRIVNEYGTDEGLAETMVLMWCFCFGHDFCHLPIVQ